MVNVPNLSGRGGTELGTIGSQPCLSPNALLYLGRILMHMKLLEYATVLKYRLTRHAVRLLLFSTNHLLNFAFRGCGSFNKLYISLQIMNHGHTTCKS